MLVSYIKVQREVKFDHIKMLEDKFYDTSFDKIKLFYDEYCQKDFPYKESDFDVSSIEEDELYMVGDKKNIYIKRYIKDLYFYGLRTFIFPLTFNRQKLDFGDNVFCITMSDYFIVGCAENMRYVNRKVFHKDHIVVLSLKCIGGL
tara:strand:- start:269 stop:706 length:438 start_codon:yes stop_codon:yes gene_type:complete